MSNYEPDDDGRIWILIVIMIGLALFLSMMGCKPAQELARRPRYERAQAPRLTRADWRAVRADYSRKVAKRDRLDSLHRIPDWRAEQDLQRRIFTWLSLGSWFTMNGLPHTYANLPI